MNKYCNLLNSASEELGISRGASESQEQWKARIIYSILGRIAYASLFDSYEEYNEDAYDSEPVSVIHLKHRVQDVFECYLEMYPEISLSIALSGRSLSNLIYDLLLKTGHIYHEPYRVCASAPSCAIESRIRFERGMPLSRHLYLSGLGTYSLEDTISAFTTCMISSTCEMFGLIKNTLSVQWNTIISRARWQKADIAGRMEFLDENNSTYYDNWSLNSPKHYSEISLSRIRMTGFDIFYLYKSLGNELIISQLPDWMIYDPQYQINQTHSYTPPLYRNVICYCLSSHGMLKPFRYYLDGSIVYLSIPPIISLPELYFVSLYSWPLDFSKALGGLRILNIQVFEAIRTTLEKIGFAFVEVSHDVIRSKLHS